MAASNPANNLYNYNSELLVNKIVGSQMKIYYNRFFVCLRWYSFSEKYLTKDKGLFNDDTSSKALDFLIWHCTVRSGNTLTFPAFRVWKECLCLLPLLLCIQQRAATYWKVHILSRVGRGRGGEKRTQNGGLGERDNKFHCLQTEPGTLSMSSFNSIVPSHFCPGFLAAKWKGRNG